MASTDAVQSQSASSAVLSSSTPSSKSSWRDILHIGPNYLPEKPKLWGSLASKSQTDVTKLPPGFSRPALFQHKHVEFRSGLGDRGGGRGFFATDIIEPGELVLAERPCTIIPDEPAEKDPAQRCILHLASGKLPLEEALLILKETSHLHPRTFEDIPQQRVKDLLNDYGDFLKEVERTPMGAKLGLCDERTLIRLLCVLHFNGFSTGLYLHLAMANHSCAANCTKWGARDGVAHSEVRAMRRIVQGEEITFAYLVPITRSREARQRALHGQFLFTCKCALCELHSDDSELGILERGPKQAIDALELLLEAIEKKDELYLDPLGTMRVCSKARNEARMKGVHPRSLCLAHADMVTIDACLALLDDERKSRVVDDQILVMTLLSRSISLRKTQILLFKCGVPEELASLINIETRADAEVTLQHILNGIAFFRSMGKAGEKVLLNLKDDEDNTVVLFAKVKDADACQVECDKAAASTAALYEEFPELETMSSGMSPVDKGKKKVSEKADPKGKAL